MFSRVTSFIVLALPLLAVATPAFVAARNDIQCCASTLDSKSPSGIDFLKSIGVDASSITGLIGLGCSPISVVGVGSGSECSSSPVSCDSFNAATLIGLGCVPVST